MKNVLLVIILFTILTQCKEMAQEKNLKLSDLNLTEQDKLWEKAKTELKE